MNYNIRPLQDSDIDSVVNLLNKYLYFGQVTKNGILKFLNSPHAFVTEHNQEIIGFITCEFMIDFNDYLLGHLDCIELINELNLFKPLIIKNLVVNEKFRNKGIASKMRQKILDNFPNHSFLTVGWKTPFGRNAQNIASKQGFTILIEKEKFWYEDSLKNKYGCSYCGKTCKCTGVIAYKK